MKRVLVDGGVHSHTRNPQFMSGSNNADGNLASVRDQDLVTAASRVESTAVTRLALFAKVANLTYLPRKPHFARSR